MSLCHSAGGLTTPKLLSSPHQSTSRNVALKLNAFAKFAPSNQPSVRIAADKPSKIQCAAPDTTSEKVSLSEEIVEPEVDDTGGGDGGNGKFPFGGGGGGGGEGDEGGGEEDEFGPIMKYDDVLIEAESRGAVLPADMVEAAKSTGLRRLILTRYLDLEVRLTIGTQLNLYEHMESDLFSHLSILFSECSMAFRISNEILFDASQSDAG